MNQQARTRSWVTRMQSVCRQFEKLAAERVVEESTGNAIEIVGIGTSNGRTLLTVNPVEAGGDFKALSVEEVASE